MLDFYQIKESMSPIKKFFYFLIFVFFLCFPQFLSKPQADKPRQDFPNHLKVSVSNAYELGSSRKAAQENEDISAEKIDDKIVFVALGDVSFSRGVEGAIKKQKNQFYPFTQIASFLREADLVFGNLETPITFGRQIQSGEMIFRSSPGVEKALKEANFRILSLANNHTLNFGEKGLKDTFFYLEKAGLQYVGAGSNEKEAFAPVFLKIKNLTLAFLAYVDPRIIPPSYQARDNHLGVAFLNLEKMKKGIEEARQKADLVFVSLHAGQEYQPMPDVLQKKFALAAIDFGADMVIGHHPHVVQTVEIYKGKPIFYSLGNFVFDQMWSQKTREGLVIEAVLSNKGIEKIFLWPVFMEKIAQPKIIINGQGAKILDRTGLSLNESLVTCFNPLAQQFETQKFKKNLLNFSPDEKERSDLKDCFEDVKVLPENQNFLFLKNTQSWPSQEELSSDYCRKINGLYCLFKVLH